MFYVQGKCNFFYVRQGWGGVLPPSPPGYVPEKLCFFIRNLCIFPIPSALKSLILTLKLQTYPIKAAYFILIYFNFESSFKLRWCRALDLLGSQILVITGGFELQISCIQSSGLGNYFVCKRFAVQTLLWSLEFVILINFEHDTIEVYFIF